MKRIFILLINMFCLYYSYSIENIGFFSEKFSTNDEMDTKYMSIINKNVFDSLKSMISNNNFKSKYSIEPIQDGKRTYKYYFSLKIEILENKNKTYKIILTVKDEKENKKLYRTKLIDSVSKLNSSCSEFAEQVMNDFDNAVKPTEKK